MAQDTKGDWQAFYTNSFVDRDAFVRFSGIGIGCQRLQAIHVPEIGIGPDAPDPVELVMSKFDDSLFAGCYRIDDDDNGVDL
ncbi:hypothetical protein BDM02DRAFT_3188674 [Thelephora ganbajun]|uniref:Uncharacterized protein n=1 Tax=Thelephora ganbajun TaxID=370292 RepID=A0ACB6ZAN9_THEGA|nr:hypothetical protein BDM02DRAFT_3188674 [Thelephora ganbajun]